MKHLFSANNTFKIIQFTDLHLGKHKHTTQDSDVIIEKDIISMIKSEKPQLIVFTGDTIDGEYCDDAKSVLKNFLKKINNLKTPWALVFGNHGETGNASKEELMKVLANFKYCLAKSGPKEVHGIGNYHVLIKDKDKKNKFSLFFLDYGSNNKKYHFDWIHENQIRWLEKNNSKYNKIPAFIFFHVPIAKYRQTKGIYQGKHLEGVDPTTHTTDFFDEIIDEKNIIATFCGHEHYNNYCTKYKGIHLCYGQNSGFDFYEPRLPGKRGARIVNINFNSKKIFETKIKLFPST